MKSMHQVPAPKTGAGDLHTHWGNLVEYPLNIKNIRHSPLPLLIFTTPTQCQDSAEVLTKHVESRQEGTAETEQRSRQARLGCLTKEEK